MKEVNKRKHVLSKAQYNLSASDIKKLLSEAGNLSNVTIKQQQQINNKVGQICPKYTVLRTPQLPQY